LLLPFYRVFKLQNDGSQQLVQTLRTVDDAKAFVQELGKLWPGEYVIHNEASGERISMIASGVGSIAGQRPALGGPD
jgi:hypothetical protein